MMCLYTWYWCIQATVQVRLKLNVMYYYCIPIFYLFCWLSQSRSKSFLDSWQVPVSPQLHFFQPEGELHFETCRKNRCTLQVSQDDSSAVFHQCLSKAYKASLFQGKLEREALQQKQCGCFLKLWYPTTMGFPTKNDQLWGVLGVPPF